VEFVAEGFFDAIVIPTVHCRVFEDNSRALEMAKNPKYCPRTKHIATKHHHFCLHVEWGNVVILLIFMVDQWVDSLTKATSVELYEAHHKVNQGW